MDMGLSRLQELGMDREDGPIAVVHRGLKESDKTERLD